MDHLNMPVIATRIARAAQGFRELLTEQQARQACFPFPSPKRHEWHFTPVNRHGLMLRHMTPPQRVAALNLLEAVCSVEGARLARSIIEHEKLLAEWEELCGTPSDFERSSDRYWVQLYGTPGNGGDPFGVHIGGHHLALNATVAGGDVALMPLFGGANPAEVRHGAARGTRLFGAEEELGFKLLHGLTEQQRAQAIVSATAFPEILSGNFRDAASVQFPEGLSAERLAIGQMEVAMQLMEVYLRRLPREAAEGYGRVLGREAPDAWRFIWAGHLSSDRPHYYAIRTPRLLIEYDNTQNGANHVHTVVRDLRSDWGADLLAQHYRAAHKSPK